MLPSFWRKKAFKADSDTAEYYTNDDVKYANSLFFHKSVKIEECPLPSYELDKLELFDLSPNHPASNKNNASRGVRAKEQLLDNTIIGWYAGIYRPGSFGNDNPYVFGVESDKYDLVIDAQTFGNITRFINDPRGTELKANLITETVTISSKGYTLQTVQFRTNRIINIGEELLFDYESSTSGYWATYGESSNTDQEIAVRDIIISNPKRKRRQVEDLTYGEFFEILKRSKNAFTFVTEISQSAIGLRKNKVLSNYSIWVDIDWIRTERRLVTQHKFKTVIDLDGENMECIFSCSVSRENNNRNKNFGGLIIRLRDVSNDWSQMKVVDSLNRGSSYYDTVQDTIEVSNPVRIIKPKKHLVVEISEQ